MDYKKAGVDIEKADRLVHWIKKQSSFKSLGNDYASLYPFPVDKYKNPVLASSTDGVGTKVKLAAYFRKWGGLGQDLVAMCVNDLICTGAKPLFFLDYYATGQLHPSQAKAFFKGLSQACRQAECPLVGGETAELPGLYEGSDMDCAGFSLGVVERSKVLGAKKVSLLDDILAFKSSGFHSNGYSLLRKVYKSPLDLKKNKNLLMKPTRLYTFLKPHSGKIKGLKAMAHITGGGLDNISRILPSKFQADLKPWKIPTPFLDVKKRAGLNWKDLLQTFNSGLGMVLIVKDKKEIFSLFPKEEIIDLGKVVKRKKSSSSWSLDFKALERVNS